MKKKILLVVVAVSFSFVFAGFAAAGQPPFGGSVVITPDNPIINVGESVDLTVDWTVNREVTRTERQVEGTSQGVNAIDGADSGTSSPLTFSGYGPGDYEVCFRIWHHQQSDRDLKECETVTVIDLVCTWFGETAWADGLPYSSDGKGNWATYTPYYSEEETVTLYAGQDMVAGTVEFSAPADGFVDITITLDEGWRFSDVTDNVKIQDYEGAPSGNPSPGQFDCKDDASGSSFVISVPENNYYGVHVDVQRCETE